MKMRSCREGVGRGGGEVDWGGVANVAWRGHGSRHAAKYVHTRGTGAGAGTAGWVSGWLGGWAEGPMIDKAAMCGYLTVCLDPPQHLKRLV